MFKSGQSMTPYGSEIMVSTLGNHGKKVPARPVNCRKTPTVR